MELRAFRARVPVSVCVPIDRWLSLYESWFAHSCNGGRETSQTYVVDSRTRWLELKDARSQHTPNTFWLHQLHACSVTHERGCVTQVVWLMHNMLCNRNLFNAWILVWQELCVLFLSRGSYHHLSAGADRHRVEVLASDMREDWHINEQEGFWRQQEVEDVKMELRKTVREDQREKPSESYSAWPTRSL